MNHSLYQDGILKALPFKRLPCRNTEELREDLNRAGFPVRTKARGSYSAE
jgi:hypothetical protein